MCQIADINANLVHRNCKRISTCSPPESLSKNPAAVVASKPSYMDDQQSHKSLMDNFVPEEPNAAPRHSSY